MIYKFIILNPLFYIQTLFSVLMKSCEIKNLLSFIRFLFYGNSREDFINKENLYIRKNFIQQIKNK